VLAGSPTYLTWVRDSTVVAPKTGAPAAQPEGGEAKGEAAA
jgi:hypothetical protein